MMLRAFGMMYCITGGTSLHSSPVVTRGIHQVRHMSDAVGRDTILHYQTTQAPLEALFGRQVAPSLEVWENRCDG